MSNAKVVMGQAANTLTAPLNVEDVFSTYLNTGDGSTETIVNGIDLAGEGGIVWHKSRSDTGDHNLFFQNGSNIDLVKPNKTDSASLNMGLYGNSFNSNGFSMGGLFNLNAVDFASWTFRKAPKFFTMVEWSGNSTMGRTISHDLGADVGFILIKAIDKADAWYALHKDSNMLVLNQTTAEYSDATTADYFGDGTNIVRPTSTEFTIGSDAGINGTGYNYIAYLFAHNDGDGGFNGGDIIKCGSYTTDGSGNSTIDLGFEPQFVITKKTSGTSDWNIWDTMRGWYNGSNYDYIAANSSAAETGNSNFGNPTATGFTSNGVIGANSTGIYIAIRRGTKVPESATEVFAMDTLGSTTPNPPSYNAGFPVDLGIMKSKTSGTDFWRVGARLTGETRLKTNSTEAEATDTQHKFDYQDGWYDAGSYVDSQYQSWMWKRAPKFFDVVAYTGTGSARTVSHNLGVAPEMMWVKKRDSSSNSNWSVYHKGLNGGTNSAEYYLRLETTNVETRNLGYWDGTSPSDSAFTLGTQVRVNGAGNTFIAYLFASLPGISKVGSWTMTTGDNNIDCGFTSGARFVLIKDASATGNWLVWDSERGIVSGNDPYLELNTTSAEFTTSDFIDPLSSGFTITSAYANFYAGNTYIFYAIA